MENNNITNIGTIVSSSEPTKVVQVAVKFRSGEVLQMGAIVPKGRYASVQSSLSTYRQGLLADEYRGKATAEESDKKWATKTKAWHELVEPAVKKSLPEICLNEVESIAPVGSLFSLREEV